MYYYRIADVTLKSRYRLLSFDQFASTRGKADVNLSGTRKQPQPGKDMVSGSIVHRVQSDGWFFHEYGITESGLFVSGDYSELKLLGEKSLWITDAEEWFVRIALECFLARRGYVSLHSAAVEVNGEAYAFSGPSGVGKSTRANAWIESVGAKLINGDRPLIDTRQFVLYGVPWDGKEQCFRNVHYPIKAICEIRRSEMNYARNMSFTQRRKLLMSQSFMPMWDTETAVLQMANISRLARGTDILRAFCGPSTEDAVTLYNILNQQQILKEEPEMKAKPEFVLRNIVDEYILMPTGDNIAKFNGTILLNEVSAFIWEKLQEPVSKDDLLKAVLDEFEVEKAVAAADLDALLETLKGYDVIEED